MKKIMLLGLAVSFLSISSMSCVMRVGASVPVPVRVHHKAHGRVKVLVIPASIRIGDMILIGNDKCIIKKKRRTKIKVVYPNGNVRWVAVTYR